MRTALPLAFRLVCVAVLTLLSYVGAAQSQSSVAIDEKTLREPWELHLPILQSLARAAVQVAGDSARAQRIDRLTLLQVTLGEYETQVDQLIDRIGFDTQFGFVAGETSATLADQLVQIRAALDALYTDLGAQQRSDVAAAQAAVDALHELLQRKYLFERDVTNALGSGFRQARVDLATRWWKGEEKAIELKKLVADLRQRLELGESRQQ